jgi:hypothetical protein
MQHCSKKECRRSEILEQYWRSYVDICIMNKISNKFLLAVLLPDSSKNTTQITYSNSYFIK